MGVFDTIAAVSTPRGKGGIAGYAVCRKTVLFLEFNYGVFGALSVDAVNASFIIAPLF